MGWSYSFTCKLRLWVTVTGGIHVPAALHSGKEPPVSSYSRHGGPQDRSKWNDSEKTLIPLLKSTLPTTAVQSIARSYGLIYQNFKYTFTNTRHPETKNNSLLVRHKVIGKKIHF